MTRLLLQAPAKRRRVASADGAVATSELSRHVIALRGIWRLLATAALLLMVPSSAAAQAPGTTLDLGMDAVTPGERAGPRIVLTASEAARVGSLRFEVAYPERLVSFVELSTTEAAKAAGLDVKLRAASSSGASDGEQEAILHVEVTATGGIPQGVLMTLVFDVSKQAPQNQKISLAGRNVVARSVDGTGINVAVIDGAISVLSDTPPVISCFFYMH